MRVGVPRPSQHVAVEHRIHERCSRPIASVQINVEPEGRRQVSIRGSPLGRRRGKRELTRPPSYVPVYACSFSARWVASETAGTTTGSMPAKPSRPGVVTESVALSGLSSSATSMTNASNGRPASETVTWKRCAPPKRSATRCRARPRRRRSRLGRRRPPAPGRPAPVPRPRARQRRCRGSSAPPRPA